MTLNEHQALTDLIELKKIDILESLGHDAISGVGVVYEMNLEKIENQISKAIINQDEQALGQVMMKLFMDYNADIIAKKAQELQDEAMQEQDDKHGVLGESELTSKHRECGVDAKDFSDE